MPDNSPQNGRLTDSCWYWILFWAVFCSSACFIPNAVKLFSFLAICSLIRPVARALRLRAGPLIAPIIIGHAGAVILVLEKVGKDHLVAVEPLTFTGMGTIASWVIAAAGWGWLVRTKEDALGFGIWARHALYYLLAIPVLVCAALYLFQPQWPPFGLKVELPRFIYADQMVALLVAYCLARTIPPLVLRAIAKWRRARANPKSKI